MMNKRKIILLSIAVVALGGLIFLVQYLLSLDDPGRQIRTVDPDTGQVLVREPNRTPETEAHNSSSVIVLGLPQLFSTGLTQAQHDFVEEQLIAFTNQEYGDVYDLIKILPDTIEKEGKRRLFTLKLGESEIRNKAELRLPDSYKAQLLIFEGGTTVFDTDIVNVEQRQLIDETSGESTRSH